MIYDLPTTATVNGIIYKIRSDYRPILDICQALVDPELTQEDKALVILAIFYEDCDSIPVEDWNKAIKECFTFINLGVENDDTQQRQPPKLMDWKQDFQYIVAPINRVLGQEIRSLDYLHWWSFIAAYYEIGDCTFAQIVRIRELKLKGKQLEQFDQEWYRNHKDLVDLKTNYTEAEKELFKQWGV